MFYFFKKNKKVKGNKLKILSGYSFNLRKVSEKSEKNIIKYANHFNFDYEFKKIKNNEYLERHIYWLKHKMLIDNLENGNHEYYWWLDSDIFFCRYENILDHIDKSKDIFVHNSFYKSKHKTKYKHIDYLTWVPNAGMILVKNTKWSLNFLKNVWNKKKYLKHFWHDNAALMDEIGLKAEIGKLTDNKLSSKVKNKVSFLSGIWNSMPKRNYENPENNEVSNFYFNPVIIHLAGIRNRDRLKFLKKYNKLFI